MHHYPPRFDLAAMLCGAIGLAVTLWFACGPEVVSWLTGLTAGWR